MNEALSFVQPTADSPWGTYLSQVDRVVPYLGHLAKWAEVGHDTVDLREVGAPGAVGRGLHE